MEKTYLLDLNDTNISDILKAQPSLEKPKKQGKNFLKINNK